MTDPGLDLKSTDFNDSFELTKSNDDIFDDVKQNKKSSKSFTNSKPKLAKSAIKFNQLQNQILKEIYSDNESSCSEIQSDEDLENEDDQFYKHLEANSYLDVSSSTRQQHEKLLIQANNNTNKISIINKEAQILQPININLTDSLYQSNNSAFESYRPTNMYSMENCTNQFNEHEINNINNNNEYQISNNNNFENCEYSERQNQLYSSNSSNSLESALIDMENSFSNRSNDSKQVKYLNYNNFSSNGIIDMNNYQQKASYQYDGNNNDYNYSDYNNSNCIDTYNNNNEAYHNNNESSFQQFSNLAQSNNHYYPPFYPNYQLQNEYYNSYQNFNNPSSLALDPSSACYSNNMIITSNDSTILNFNRNQIFN